MNKTVEKGAKWLLVVGGVNWGLAKFMNIDLVTKLPNDMLQTAVYGAIAASAVYMGYLLIKKKA